MEEKREEKREETLEGKRDNKLFKKHLKNILIASVGLLLSVFLVVFAVSAIDAIGSDGDLRISLVVAGVAALVSLIVLVIWVIPVHLVLTKKGRYSFVWYALPAILPGFIFVFVFKPFGNDPFFGLLSQALFCSFVGLAAGGVFWFFAVYRPQRTEKALK